MRDFLESLEHRVLTGLAILFGLNSLFFIAPQTKLLTLVRLTGNNDIFYFLYVTLGLLIVGAIVYFNRRFDWKVWLGAFLATITPGILILCYGLIESQNFHYLFQIAVGIYVISFGILLSTFVLERDHHTYPETAADSLSLKAWLRAQGALTYLLLTLATSFFFGFGFYHLTQYAAVDEPLWFDGRIARYWHNIEERDWDGTDISDKPGITIALASGPGLWFKTTKDYRTVSFQGEVSGLKDNLEEFYLAYRLPLLIVITLLLPLFYFFLERLFGKEAALLSYLFIATSPILIGMSKIINPDSLLWIFTPLSLITYLVFLKRRWHRYLILSGIFLGFALLTKYIANILFIFFLGLIFLEYLYHPQQNPLPFPLFLRRSFVHFIVLTFAALTTVYCFFPLTWVDPSALITSTLLSEAFVKVAPLFVIVFSLILIDQWFNQSRIVAALIKSLEKWKHWLVSLVSLVFLTASLITIGNTWMGMRLYDFMDLLAAPKSIADKSDFIGIFLTNFYPILFGIPPIVLLLFLVAPICIFIRRHSLSSTRLRVIFYFIVFILLYYLGATVNNVASIVRYQIIIFPLVAMVAGIVLAFFLEWLDSRFKFAHPGRGQAAAAVLLLVGTSTLLMTPFPLSYASSFLPSRYHVDVKDMGPGSYEAAQYLNSLPEAESMLIWTDKIGVCKFFVGRCKRGLDYEKLRRDGLDYVVVSSGRESRTSTMMRGDIDAEQSGLIRFDEYYEGTSTPDFEILINSRPSHFVRVFRFEE